jgi:ubiquinone/menaquinone biosynthesis C-methylase UbiE
MKDPVDVFSDRVQNYLAYRPGYTIALLDLLRAVCNFNENAVIADIGSGTGLLSELFLKNGNLVFGIEPNSEMRIAGKNKLRTYAGFISVAGRAEATTLKTHSIDFVTAGQAFHWFDLEPTKKEFIRILKPMGWVIVVYNIARTDTPFQRVYRDFCTTYLGEKSAETDDRDIYSKIFSERNFTEKQIAGVSQRFDFKDLTGRVCSRANAPKEGTPRYSEMMATLLTIFEQHQRDGEVMISYDTQVVYGQMSR